MVGERRVIDGVSALLLPLPLRYAAVVPAQNASGCSMPWGDSTGRMAANWSTNITETARMRFYTGDKKQQQHFLRRGMLPRRARRKFRTNRAGGIIQPTVSKLHQRTL